ncbi:hypothetical protein [Caudoviricetes sp.]|nr:hypothetical protein [Caudoviricetes sp.]
MSNTLQKVSTPIFTRVPGITVTTWHPPVTSTNTVYSYVENGYVLDATFPESSGGVSLSIPTDKIVVETKDAFGNPTGYSVYKPVYITQSRTVTTTSPGYYSYETFPDTYTITFDPNIGWTGSATSKKVITGDAVARFSPDASIPGAIVGLNHVYGSETPIYSDIDHALYFYNGTYRVIENGVFKTVNTGTNTYVTGDVFSIYRLGTRILYYINSTNVYSSNSTIVGDVLLDASLYSSGGMIRDASIDVEISIVRRSAILIGTSKIKGTPKAKAKIKNDRSVVKINGSYTTGDDVHALKVAIKGTSKVSSLKNPRTATVRGTSKLKYIPPVQNSINTGFSNLSARLTSGYFQYNSIDSSFQRMTSDSRSGQIIPIVSILNTSFQSMTSRSTAISGISGTVSASFGNMTALLSNKVYAGITASFNSMTSFSVEGIRDSQFKVYIKDYIDFDSTIKLKEFLTILEYIFVIASNSSSQRLKNTVTEVISVIDKLLISLKAVISESISVGSSISGIITQIEEIVNAIIVNSSSSTKVTFLNTITNLISILSSVSFGINLSISDGIAVSSTISNLYKAIATVLESVSTDTTVSDKAKVSVVLLNSIIQQDLVSSEATFKDVLKDSFVISIPTASGQDTYLAYLFSPETSSVTNYNNYNFDGCTKFNNKYLFYNKSGLYEYGGTLDDTSAIVANFETSALNLGTSNLKQVPSLYMGLSNDNSVVLKIRVDGKATTIYKLNKRTENLSTQKIDIGKGLIGRYFQFEIITDASNFNMESIEFFPIELKRKL